MSNPSSPSGSIQLNGSLIGNLTIIINLPPRNDDGDNSISPVISPDPWGTEEKEPNQDFMDKTAASIVSVLNELLATYHSKQSQEPPASPSA